MGASHPPASLSRGRRDTPPSSAHPLTSLPSLEQVLNSSDLPLTFLFAQLVLAVLLIQACTLFGFLTLPPFDPALCKVISGVVVVNVVGLVFNTLCLKLVDASYFQVRLLPSPPFCFWLPFLGGQALEKRKWVQAVQAETPFFVPFHPSLRSSDPRHPSPLIMQVARGLVLPLTVLLASLLLKSMPPPSTLVAVALVVIGFFYGITPSAASPTNASSNTHLGIVYGVASAAMIAVHAILVKWSMRNVDVKEMDATYVTKYVPLSFLFLSLPPPPLLALLLFAFVPFVRGPITYTPPPPSLPGFNSIAYLTNLLSALGLFPILILTGEVFRWKSLLTNEDGQLGTFLIGSLITVRSPFPFPRSQNSPIPPIVPLGFEADIV